MMTNMNDRKLQEPPGWRLKDLVCDPKQQILVTVTVIILGTKARDFLWDSAQESVDEPSCRLDSRKGEIGVSMKIESVGTKNIGVQKFCARSTFRTIKSQNLLITSPDHKMQDQRQREKAPFSEISV